MQLTLCLLPSLPLVVRMTMTNPCFAVRLQTDVRDSPNTILCDSLCDVHLFVWSVVVVGALSGVDSELYGCSG